MNNDLISRSALKKQFANECLHNCYYCKLSKWDKEGACYNCGLIDNAPTVEPYCYFCGQKEHGIRPQGDSISRSALKKALHNFFDGKVIDEHTYILRDVFCYIDNAPTEPQITVCCENADEKTIEEVKAELERVINEIRPLRGEWVTDDQTYSTWRCNKCLHVQTICSNFCPNCGADMRSELCSHDCDKCEHGVPIDGLFYDDGTPIHECGLPRDLTDWELERFMAHGHPICDCEQKCDKCPSWIVNICNNYDYYEKKYKKGADK